jgi:hypothetical protein
MHRSSFAGFQRAEKSAALQENKDVPQGLKRV